MSGRLVIAAALGVGGLILGLGLLSRDTGPLASPQSRVLVPDAVPARLDTLAIRGRRVEVTLNGLVMQIGPGDDVWLSVDGDALPLRFGDAAGIEVEDRLLVVGRLRARGGRRWVDVAEWTRIEADVRPPSGAGL